MLSMREKYVPPWLGIIPTLRCLNSFTRFSAAVSRASYSAIWRSRNCLVLPASLRLSPSERSTNKLRIASTTRVAS